MVQRLEQEWNPDCEFRLALATKSLFAGAIAIVMAATFRAKMSGLPAVLATIDPRIEASLARNLLCRWFMAGLIPGSVIFLDAVLSAENYGLPRCPLSVILGSTVLGLGIIGLVYYEFLDLRTRPSGEGKGAK
ncbi:MAG TPA: hypothetical protein VM286_04535 [Candidatus Thermoplasmatota archaeon]|nr:hypothetical protein [Candidatus Thermoplasmatota archaeon]